MAFKSFSDLSGSDGVSLIARVQEMARKATLKAKAEPAAINRFETGISCMPGWREEVRGMPNELLRSALFNAKNRSEARRYFRSAVVAVVDKTVRITYTGEELRQDDESVWLQLIHWQRGRNNNCFIEFTAYRMIKELGWAKHKPSSAHTARLLATLQRMQATALAVYSPRLGKTVSFSMIPVFEWKDEGTGKRLQKWRLRMAPELVELFGETHFTRVQWRQRQDLPLGLATWMHGYYATHKKPVPILLETIQRGSGCSTTTSRKFKQLVNGALQELKRVGFLKNGNIVGDLVRVERE